MGQIETHIGVLRPVIKTNEAETTNEVIVRLLGDVELTEKEEDLFKQLKDVDDNYNRYFLFDGILYEVENKELDGDDVYEATFMLDGTIKYTLQFYNGGASFNEMMGYALNKIK